MHKAAPPTPCRGKSSIPTIKRYLPQPTYRRSEQVSSQRALRLDARASAGPRRWRGERSGSTREQAQGRIAGVASAPARRASTTPRRFTARTARATTWQHPADAPAARACCSHNCSHCSHIELLAASVFKPWPLARALPTAPAPSRRLKAPPLCRRRTDNKRRRKNSSSFRPPPSDSSRCALLGPLLGLATRDGLGIQTTLREGACEQVVLKGGVRRPSAT